MMEDDYLEIRSLIKSAPMSNDQREILITLLEASQSCDRSNPFVATDILWVAFELSAQWGLRDIKDALWHAWTGE